MRLLIADVVYRANVLLMRGVSDSDAVIQQPPPCSECGESIALGIGRFNVGRKRYHVECYDPTRHMVQQP
jgi:hypothetical protein